MPTPWISEHQQYDDTLANTISRLHATAVEPRLKEHKDMAGGVEPPKPEYPHEEHGEIASLSNDGDEPTEEERRTLRKVSDKLPWAAFIICIIELCERFTYYGLSGPFQNYIENSYGGRVPGAIGLGQTGATGLTDFFQFWCYVCPVRVKPKDQIPRPLWVHISICTKSPTGCVSVRHRLGRDFAESSVCGQQRCGVELHGIMLIVSLL
jgi:hypothetical protein